MKLFSSLLKNNTEYCTIEDCVSKGRMPMGVLGVSLTPKSHLISTLCDSLNKKALIITHDESTATKICSDLNTMGMRAYLYPAADRNFHSTESRSREYERKRLGVLENICKNNYDAVVCSIEAAMQYTIPKDILIKKSITLKNGEDVAPSAVVDSLISAGYVRSEMVEGEGQFSLRGSILDFFPPGAKMPVRIDFWGDTIESMAYFDILSQRRGESAKEVPISPATEIVFDSDTEFAQKIMDFANTLNGKKNDKIKESLYADATSLQSGVRLNSNDRYLNIAYDRCATIFDYCSECLLFATESSNIKEKAASLSQMLLEDIKAMLDDGVLCKGLDSFSMSWQDVVSEYENFGVIYLDNFSRGSFDTPVKELINMNVRQNSPWEGAINILREDLSPDLAKGYTVIVLAGTHKMAQSLCIDLNDDGFSSHYFPIPPSAFIKGAVNIVPGALCFGMDYPGDKIKFVTYGRYRTPGSKQNTAKNKFHDISKGLHSIEELQKGDYVVHKKYGIGLFDGIEKVTFSGITKDYFKIKYRGSDVLHVPITQMDLISKYIGPHEDSGKAVKLSKMGSTADWEKTKSRVKSAVRDMAKELLQLYAIRQKTPGYAFSEDIDMQSDFERRFEYEETDDQLRCINEIKHDMEQPYPMDRLLCGDVGFGKTEVALRAAFKCVADSKQCVILVPTTILALQHYQTILRRFEGFPIKIEMLSRFVTPKQQAKIVRDVKNGQIDILVGTHRVISKDIIFRNLGLVIIDEEQRFGVAQKEKFKTSFPGVDILTLSATPIPRTLNMAMTGIRDMSAIEEAPLDRLPIQSYVMEHDMGILAEAMEKELRRGGQIFYLHNRVEDIDDTAAEIQKHIPDAAIGIAHGKMSESELSEIWRQMLEGEINILVCTTIIETGIDIPNANTLIIENADCMGLAQLHQIRGRVGRSSRRAFAYFTFKRGKNLSEIAQKRLNAIREYTEFGSGFKIAMKDLEIRGAGNLLGAKQHGHLEAVGYDMYLEMLSEAVVEEQTQVVKQDEPECLVDVSIEAHIPEKYIDSTPQRLAMYRRIASVRSEDDAEDALNELADRYGEPPTSVKGLVTVSLIRNSAMKHGIHLINQNGDRILFFSNNLTADILSPLLKTMRNRIVINLTNKPFFSVKVEKNENVLDLVRRVLRLMDAGQN